MNEQRVHEHPSGRLLPDANFTVAEAARFLVGLPAPLTTSDLGKLGKDCSMVCRIKGLQWTIRPTPLALWPSERAYPAAVIQEVFKTNPMTAPYVPQPKTQEQTA
ncbi:BcepNY3gp55 [Burkholderia phage BcepNY3]|nr:BcepNY3gp55 [Burkholderia phage BcepNY3]ABR10590.1 BcepNY3gp55 [Burkholderia phage BcepNY3]